MSPPGQLEQYIQQWLPTGIPPHIHAQVVHPDDIKRFGELNLVTEINPYHVSDDMRWMEERIGKERSLGAYAFRKLKSSGAVLIFGSDSPGTNAARYFLSPVYGLYAAVSPSNARAVNQAKGGTRTNGLPSKRRSRPTRKALLGPRSRRTSKAR